MVRLNRARGVETLEFRPASTDPTATLGAAARAAARVKEGEPTAWIDAFVAAARRAGATSAVDIRRLEAAPTPQGGGTLDLGPPMRLCAREPGHRAYWALPTPPGAGEVLIAAGVIRIEQAEDEKVQLRFGHGEGFEEEILRFTSSQIGVARRARLPSRPVGRSTPFALAVKGDRIAVWLDGALVYRGARSRKEYPRTLILDLLPVDGKPAEVAIEALLMSRIAELPQLNLWPEDEPTTALAFEAAETGEFEAFARALNLIDGAPPIDDQGVEVALGRLLAASDIDETTFERFCALCTPQNANLNRSLRSNRKSLPLVDFEGVTLRFAKNPAHATSLEGLFAPKGGERFDALRDVSFRVWPGDILGVIGRNGSGKTTLLRAIMGLFPISAGAITVHGRPLLLRPGAGMREDLSGRENIIMAALFMGLSMKQARGIVDEVIEFAELEAAIDRPYKYYSDGMRARLVFSVATTMTTEVLLLDELLSAGDIAFQAKAQKRLEEFIGRARSVIVVEHGLAFVKASATKVLLLDKGIPIYYGAPEGALDAYTLDLMSELSHRAPRP